MITSNSCKAVWLIYKAQSYGPLRDRENERVKKEKKLRNLKSYTSCTLHWYEEFSHKQSVIYINGWKDKKTFRIIE